MSNAVESKVAAHAGSGRSLLPARPAIVIDFLAVADRAIQIGDSPSTQLVYRIQ
jgi:hypothetical protein